MNDLKKMYNKLKKIPFEKVIKMVKIATAILPAIFIIFNCLYDARCKSFYGIDLNCFNTSVYQSRWLFIVFIFILAVIYYLYRKILITNKNNMSVVIYETFLNWIIIFSYNAVMFIAVMNNTSINFIVNFAIKYSIIFFIILGVVSLCVAISSMNFKTKKKSRKIFAIFFILEIVFTASCIYSFGAPDPQNINSYTIATVKMEDNTFEQYIVVGEYNNDFVCMKIQNANDENDQEINLNIDLNNDNQANNEAYLNYSKISVKKSEYNLFSADKIQKFNTYKYITVNMI